MDALVEEGWTPFAAEFGLGSGSGLATGAQAGRKPAEQQAGRQEAAERELAEMVVHEPDRHPWRVVDAAYDRLRCPECGGRLSRGPVGCGACDVANGFRFSAIEIDRPGVVPGNEHAIRVNVAVVRRPHWVSEHELIARRLLLPVLLDGHLPTTEQAQAARAVLRRGGGEREYAELVYRDWAGGS
ncbi:hypothetical protein ACIBG7_10785 [Nonomuraea sp. NPDC050328]|uniref:hypothetical protein n=1 Tax=Nonomuraea sp. NPDC050328 TaxID=3364361 RepID=UPI003793FDD3